MDNVQKVNIIVYVWKQGREVDHSPPASAEVKKTWIYIFTLPFAFMVYSLIIKHRDNFIFFTLIFGNTSLRIFDVVLEIRIGGTYSYHCFIKNIFNWQNIHTPKIVLVMTWLSGKCSWNFFDSPCKQLPEFSVLLERWDKTQCREHYGLSGNSFNSDVPRAPDASETRKSRGWEAEFQT
jgi:hypothetical protein